GKPVVLDPQLHHVLGLGEGGVGCILVAEHEPKPDIALRAIVPDFSGAVLGGVFEVHHRRQRLIVDLDQFGGIARLGQRLGDDERDAVADEAHLLGIEDRLNVRWPLGAPKSSGIRWAVKLPSFSATASAPVSTQSTPGAALALATSTRLMRAWACGESTVTP